MSVDLLIPKVGSKDPTTIAVEAEQLGYETVWLGELWNDSAVVHLSEIACATEHVGLGTAILNVFSRSPAVLAMTAATLDRISDGRFQLGLGVSTKTAIEDLHGIPFDRPVRRAHETIELIKKFTDEGAEPVSYDGELIEVEGFQSLDADVPIYHSGLGKLSRRVVGRLCDGWIPHNIPFSMLNEAFETVERAAVERARDPAAITVTPYVPAAVSRDPAEAVAAIRKHVAYYVASGSGYRNAVAMRFPDEAERVSRAWNDGDRRAATSHVTDDMVRDLGVAGTPDEARRQLREIREIAAIDRVILKIPNPVVDRMGDTTIEALAPTNSTDKL